MAISDAQFIAWLSQEHADRVVLYEQDYMYELDGEPAQGTLFLSDKPYLKFTGDSNGDGLPYVECLAGVPEFTRSLGGNLLNTYSSSIGSVEIVNTDGELDFLLDLAIDGNSARFYYGDASWEREDFRVMFQVLGLRVQRAPFRRITIDLKDSTAILNKSVGGTTLVGGVGPYANNARPLNVGYVHNLTPLSLDSINLTYVHSDSIFAVAQEVRDDGIPVTFTDNGDGTLELDAAPAGLITCDVYSVTVAGLDKVSDTFDRIVGARGGLTAGGLYFGVHPTFVIGDVDDYPLGLSIQDARNILELLGEITESGNCFSAIRRDGQFTFGRLKPYDIASFGLDPVNIVEDDIVPRGSFDVEHLVPDYYQYQAYEHKNWTVQSNLSALLAPDEQARFQRKGQYALQQLVGGTTYAVAPELYHKTLSVSPPIETLISEEDDSDIVALTQWMETRRAIFLPWLEIATVSLPLGANPDEPAMFYALELGDVTRVTLPRFGYDAGVLFQAISVGINLSKARVAIRMVRKRGISDPPIGWQTIEQYIIQTPLTYRLGPPIISVVPTVPPIVPPGAPGGPPGGPVIIIGGPGGGGGPPSATDIVYFFERFKITVGAFLVDEDDPEDGDYGSVDAGLQNPPGGQDPSATLPFMEFIGVDNALFGDTPQYAYASITPESPDYFVEASFGYVYGSFAAGSTVRLIARKSADTYYELRVEFDAGTSGTGFSYIAIDIYVAGSLSGTFYESFDVAMAWEELHYLRWELNGADHFIYVDGALLGGGDVEGTITLAGSEIGFGISNRNDGEYDFDVQIHSVMCGTLVASPRFDVTVDSPGDLDITTLHSLSYPNTFIQNQLNVRLCNNDPAIVFAWQITGAVGFAGGTGAGFTSDDDTNHIPFVNVDFYGSEVDPNVATIQALRNGISWGTPITVEPL